MENIDLEAIGLRVGLEIHRQLKGRKLFCGCPGQLEEREIMRVRRKLGLSRSERGELDIAAVREIERTRWIDYSITGNSCLVEIDEEPPHMPDDKTIEGALMVSMLLGCAVPNELLFMRKIVVDGSNPSGFQRTAIVGTGGSCILGGGSRITIDSVCLEEDAARRMDAEDRMPIYRLDRLGIPEVEISTGPEITSPAAAHEIAAHIGELLRSTRRVRRGIGTIRQDINISIIGGSRVEIKLVQDLESIPVLIIKEAIRQLLLIEIGKDLVQTVKKEYITLETIDLSRLFDGTGSKVLSRGMENGGIVLGLALKGMGGFLGTRERQARIRGEPLTAVRKDIDDVKRLGPEIASHARVMAGVKGLFHSDELPNYGISASDVEAVFSALNIGVEKDAFVMVCAPRKTAEKALKAVHERVLTAFDGVPGEVRRPLPDGRTEYMRPLPGAARMYPETDIPPIPIDHHYLEEIKTMFPEPKDALFLRLQNSTGLQGEVISQLYSHELIDRFEDLVAAGADPRLLSRLLINILPVELKDDEDCEMISNIAVLKVLEAVRVGKIAKEALDSIIGPLLRDIREGKDENGSLESILKYHSSGENILEEMEVFIRDLVVRKKDLITLKGDRSVGPLMGEVMKVYRGKVDGKVISAMLMREISKEVDGL